jgi:pyruvate-formate lyase
MRAIQAEVLLKLFSGDLGATMEIGGSVNHYYHNACNVAVRQLDLSKQIGVPQPAISSADLAKGSL